MTDQPEAPFNKWDNAALRNNIGDKISQLMKGMGYTENTTAEDIRLTLHAVATVIAVISGVYGLYVPLNESYFQQLALFLLYGALFLGGYATTYRLPDGCTFVGRNKQGEDVYVVSKLPAMTGRLTLGMRIGTTKKQINLDEFSVGEIVHVDGFVSDDALKKKLQKLESNCKKA
eukprot:Clim_evm24s196 gene=Clim_evmTU24s196